MRLNNKRTVLIGLAFMSICAFWQIYDNVIPLILENTFGLNTKTTGAIMGIDNILALFMLPLFGMLSDRTKTKIGRRMPYIVFGTVVAVACVILLPFAQQKQSFTLFIITVGVLLVAMSTYRSPAVALMPDVTMKPLRSKANAIINLMGAVGGAVMLGVTPLLVKTGSEDYTVLFYALAVFMVFCVFVMFFNIKEPACAIEMQKESAAYGLADSPESTAGPANNKKMPSAVQKSFFMILCSIFLWFMGYNAVTTGFTRYAQNIWDRGIGSASAILMVAQVAAILSYIPVGMIATRIGRKKTILCGVAMLTAAFGASLLFTDFSYFMFVFFALAGIAWAFINVNSYPMVVEMSKGSNVGKYTGYYYLFSMAAQSVTPLFSGILIDAMGWRLLFPYGSIFVGLSFVTMLFVKHGDSRPQAPKTRLEAFDTED